MRVMELDGAPAITSHTWLEIVQCAMKFIDQVKAGKCTQ